MYSILKIILFRLSAEKAHDLTMTLFNWLCYFPPTRYFIRKIFQLENDHLKFSLWGLNFLNPVGLAAGFDKDGKYIRSMSLLGFGFIELGTVTPKPQTGNTKPRLFRLKEDRAIINRMGFNNLGVDHLVGQLKKLKSTEIVLGGNIGKNKETPNQDAYKDYLICFEKLYPHVDYFVVNLSSPNTPGLRSLQEKKPLQHLLSTLIEYRNGQNKRKPIVLKIAPDLNDSQLEDVVEIVRSLGIDGIIATNTTISREGLLTESSKVAEFGAGGLSGKPLFRRSNEVISKISTTTKGSVPIIGVGGVDNPENGLAKLEAGASLIQVYSGLIYNGPFLVKKIKKLLLQKASTKKI